TTQRPVAGSQVSAVQTFPSSQLTGSWTHSTVVSSQRSGVQGLESLQTPAVARQTRVPPSSTQNSAEVQALPSSQGVPGATKSPRQIPPWRQVSETVQPFRSSHEEPTGRKV